MERLFFALRKILYFISIAAIALMLVIIFFQVISRYIFGYTFDWSEELSRFLFVWVVFIGSALIIGDKGHMAVQLLPDMLSGKRTGLYLQIFIKLASLAFILLLIGQGSKMTRTMMFQTAPALNLPMGIVYSIIPVSGVLMLFYLIRDSLVLFAENKKARGKEA